MRAHIKLIVAKASTYIRDYGLSSVWLLVFSAVVIKWLYDEQLRQYPSSLYISVGLYCVAVALIIFAHQVALVTSWFGFGVMLVYIWIYNGPPPWQHKFFGFLLICLIFFILEGTELAYTELRDKDSERLPETIRTVIEDINNDRSVFYDARELLVVLLVAGLTVWSDYDELSLPLVGHTRDRRWIITFTLVFTSVLIIWLAQKPSKELATRNSVAFLRKFGFPLLWNIIIKPLGLVMRHLRVNAPANLIRNVLETMRGLKSERNLPPSRHSFYVDALKAYGYSYHFAEDKLTVTDSGAGVFEHRCLIYISDGAKRSSCEVKYKFDGSIQPPAIVEHSVYTIPTFGETMSPGYNEDLRAIFDKNQLPPGVTMYPSLLRTEIGTSQDNQEIKVAIYAPGPLPECLPVDGKGAQAAALLLNLKVSLAPGSFVIPAEGGESRISKDHWHRIMAVPCGEYRVSVDVEAKGKFQIANFTSRVMFWEHHHPAESARLTKQPELLSSGPREKLVLYPLTGAEYQFEWEVWRR